MIKRLHVLVLKSFVGPFVLIFFVVIFILLMQFLWRYIDELVGKGLEVRVIAELLLYTSASLVPMALPLAILMSSLMTFGNMGEFYELTAIKASGISLQRVMLPLFVLVFFISIAAFFFANNVMPYTNLKMRSLLYDVRKQRPEITIMPGTFYNGMDGYSIRIDRKDPKTNVMYNIKIYDHTEKRGNVSVTLADSGTMIVTKDKRNLILTLYSGYSYNEMQEQNEEKRKRSFPHRYDRFGERQIVIELVGFDLERTNESLFKSHYQMMNLSQLTIMADSMKSEIDSKQKILFTSLLQDNYFRKHNSPKNDFRKPVISSDSAKFKKMNRLFSQERIKSHQLAMNEAGIKDTLTGKNEISKENKDTLQVKTTVTTQAATKKIRQLQPNTDYFSLLTVNEQSKILEDALTSARSSRTYVVNTLQMIKYKEEQLRRYEIERQRKFTIAFACLIFLLIGAPFGAIIRKGGLGFPLVISTFCFIFYYVISLFAEKMVRESFVSDYQGMWFTPAVFLVVGIFFTYKATTDASILNMDTYYNFFKKTFGRRRMSLIESLHKDDIKLDSKHIREDNLVASLSSFLELIKQNMNAIEDKMKPAGFLASLVEIQGNSDLILFERLYRNFGYSIIQSEYYVNKPVKLKLFSLPGFKASHYIDIGFMFYVRMILLFLPPLTLIIIIREYILLHMIKSRFKLIYEGAEELMYLVKKTSA